MGLGHEVGYLSGRRNQSERFRANWWPVGGGRNILLAHLHFLRLPKKESGERGNLDWN